MNLKFNLLLVFQIDAKITIFSTHLQDLKDATRDLYENYRAKYIQEHVINMPINKTNSKVKCSESILAAKDTEVSLSFIQTI